MTGFYRKIYGVICGLMLLWSLGAQAYAADLCTTEVLREVLRNETTAYAMPNDLKFELLLKKGLDLGVRPKEELDLDKASVLKKDFLYTLDSHQLAGRHNLKKELVVQAENGQKYKLSKGKPFRLVVPPDANYTAIIPAEKLKQEGSTPEKYTLLEDLTVNITLPRTIS